MKSDKRKPLPLSKRQTIVIKLMFGGEKPSDVWKKLVKLISYILLKTFEQLNI